MNIVNFRGPLVAYPKKANKFDLQPVPNPLLKYSLYGPTYGYKQI
jgi:hypothetical protein